MKKLYRLLNQRSYVIRALVFTMLNFGVASSWADSVNVNAVDKNGALMSDVVVYATPVGVPLPPAEKLPLVNIAQEDLQFSPYVTAVRVGTQIKFPNMDKMLHHVKSFSPAKQFESKLYKKDTPTPVLFDKPGIVIIYCMIHDWMRAYVMVVDTPYFAKTEATGTVTLNGLPSGSYEIRAWHPDLGTLKPPLLQTISVSNKSTQLIKFNFDFVAKKQKPKQINSSNSEY